MTSPGDVEDLPPSELGTKKYWDSAYEVEIQNFENHGAVGEIWFGEDSAMRIVRWLTETELVAKEDPIVDLGCGNGMMLVDLDDEGFTNLTGVDYSDQAIELAKRVMKNKGLENITLMTCDIVGDELALSNYAVVLDKGTYDAISLNPENAKSQRTSYKTNIKKILRHKGLFVIASCNWTEEELKQHFGDDMDLSNKLNTLSVPEGPERIGLTELVEPCGYQMQSAKQHLHATYGPSIILGSII